MAEMSRKKAVAELSLESETPPIIDPSKLVPDGQDSSKNPDVVKVLLEQQSPLESSAVSPLHSTILPQDTSLTKESSLPLTKEPSPTLIKSDTLKVLEQSPLESSPVLPSNTILSLETPTVNPLLLRALEVDKISLFCFYRVLCSSFF
jgi:hypothetical protein